MSKRMQAKPVKATRNTAKNFTTTARMQAAMLKVAHIAATQSRKDEATQQAARKAIAETVDEWITFLADDHPDAVDEFYYEICMLASAGNRRRIAKHALVPEGLVERVEDDLQQQKEQAEREAAAAQAREGSKAGGDHSPV